MEKISVIVPCYNAKKSIKKCINSLKKQNCDNFEVLLIDDGSTDNTKDIIKKEIKNDNRFKYVHKKNGGVSSTRNKGIKLAKGNYIAFLDSDDWVEENYLKSLYNTLIENDSDLSVCNIKRIYKNKTTYNIIKNNSDLLKYTAPWNKLYKKELFDKNDIFFPENVWYEDITVSVKTYLLSNKISIDNHFLHNYIQNEKSLVHTYDDRIFDIYIIIEELEDFCKKKKIYKKNYSDLEFLSIYHILIGTIYRSSFHQNFNLNMVKDIIKYVEKKYPNWYKNEHLKSLPITFKLYLFLIKSKLIFLIYFLLKRFNKFMKL